MLRNVTFDRFLFMNLPVYQRGGKLVRKLFEEYNSIMVESSKSGLGKHYFEAIVKMTTEKGESKTGLATYYVKLQHQTKLFEKILLRITFLLPILETRVTQLQKK